MAPLPGAWRVESGGRPHHTKIYDGQGNLVPLDGIVAVRWEVTAGTVGQITGEGTAPADQPRIPRGQSEQVVA